MYSCNTYHFLAKFSSMCTSVLLVWKAKTFDKIHILSLLMEITQHGQFLLFNISFKWKYCSAILDIDIMYFSK